MNIHFSELLLILFVALLAIKPERLPEVAFTLGRCLRWLRSLSAKMKSFVEQPEMGKYSFHTSSTKSEILEHE